MSMSASAPSSSSSSSTSGVPRPWSESDLEKDMPLTPVNWVDEQTALLSSYYTVPIELKIAVCTYNVDQGRPPPDMGLLCPIPSFLSPLFLSAVRLRGGLGLRLFVLGGEHKTKIPTQRNGCIFEVRLKSLPLACKKWICL